MYSSVICCAAYVHSLVVAASLFPDSFGKILCDSDVVGKLNESAQRSKHSNARIFKFCYIYLLIAISLIPLVVRLVFIIIAVIIISRIIIGVLLGWACILRLLRSVFLPNIGEIRIRVLR